VEPIAKTALVVANGTLPSAPILASLVSFDPFILAADGGANRLLERGIVANAVIGDFDSLRSDFPPSVERISAGDQDYTDLDKSVDYLVKNGYDTVWLIGATGNRLDHTFGALSVLLKYGKSAQIALIDDIGTACPVNGTLVIEADIGQTISLIAVGEVPSISTSGLKWNLNNESLAPGIRDGISNIAAAKEVTITSESGPLIVYSFHGILPH
jgi:thiamine pyrophosphokinase